MHVRLRSHPKSPLFVFPFCVICIYDIRAGPALSPRSALTSPLFCLGGCITDGDGSHQWSSCYPVWRHRQYQCHVSSACHCLPALCSLLSQPPVGVYSRYFPLLRLFQ
ncbi:hypothetical protein BOTBODRAFT_587912 [Botryobasidium botryosum FD-172 SS1]|uniref:Uncharacterized protein n=1 Tax=Botryobasidium botryosum (strain FD-172 SS1) TaxID=930990 RepID=A0A067LX91_BOTB1|nr:hypothetical protein BOTBODRAFT_587912 [Botryobasidium botryosum FD-172 SS1]